MNYSNELERLFFTYPNGIANNMVSGWFRYGLSSHPQLTFRMVVSDLSSWRHAYVLKNSALTIEERLELIDLIHQNNIRYLKSDMSIEVSDHRLIIRLLECKMTRLSRMVDNRRLSLETIQYFLKFDKFKNHLNRQHLYRNKNPEVIKWIIGGDSPVKEVCWNSVLNNRHLDGQLIDQILDIYINRAAISTAMILEYRVKMSESQIMRLIKSDRFREDSLDNRWFIYHVLDFENCTTEVSSYIFDSFSEIIKVLDDKIFDYGCGSEMSEELVDKLMNDTRVHYKNLVRSKSVTDKILYKLANRQYQNVTAEDDKIAKLIIQSYVINQRIIDKQVIDALSDLEGGYWKYFSIVDEDDLKHIEWKLYDNDKVYLSPIIAKIEDLKILVSKYLPWISRFQFQCEVDDEILKILVENKLLNSDKTKSKVDMKWLTINIDYELIIDNPNLPWRHSKLLTREYHQNNKFLKTKSAKSK